MSPRRRLSLCLIICSLVLLAAPLCGLAQTWYVAGDGQDGAAGSAQSPWRTIQHAVDYARPGDVIEVAGGTYAGFRIESSGQEDAWITLKASPAAEVVIDRPGDKNRHRSNIELENYSAPVAYWRLEGLEVTGAPRHGIDLRGGRDHFSHHLVVAASRIHDSGRSGIFTAFTHWVWATANQSYGNGEHGIYFSNSGDDAWAQDNDLYDNYACGFQANGDLSMGGDGVISRLTVERNRIHGNGRGGGAGINLDGVTQAWVRDNHLYENRAGGIAIFQGDGAVATSQTVVEANTIRMPAGSRWAVNITDAECEDITLRDNQIYHAGPRGSIRLPSAHLAGFTSEGNTLTPRFSIDGGDSIMGWEAWRALGYDQTSQALN